MAVEKLDGALADGRLLQVALRDQSKFTSAVQPAPSPVPALQSSPAVAAPAANKRELFPAIPSGPKAQQQQRTNSGRELLQPAQTQQPASRRAPVAAPSLQSRLMSAAELKALQRQQARTAAAARVVPGMPTGPKGTVATPASSHSMALAKRITLPLSMRLSDQAKQTGCVCAWRCPYPTVLGLTPLLSPCEQPDAEQEEKGKGKGKEGQRNGSRLGPSRKSVVPLLLLCSCSVLKVYPSDTVA